LGGIGIKNGYIWPSKNLNKFLNHNKMYKKLLLVTPLALLMSCGAQEEETTTPEPEVPEVVEPTTDEEITQYLTEKGWTGVRHESGLYVVTDTAGSAEHPALTDSVTIFYQGYLLDGTQFDGTMETPATFLLSDLIEGWQIGIPMFGKGGKGKLLIPSDLAYGDMDNGQIPGGSTLMFEIELVDFVVNEPAQ
jgi:FKBP-type peptidyl-prolyl cis-trans isomerase FkpA